MAAHATSDCGRPLARGEVSRIWRVEALPDVELLFGRYRQFTFARHFHDGMTMGVIESGAMRLYCNGREHVAEAGSVVLVSPGDVHAPLPAGGDGWQFRILYVEPALLKDWADRMERQGPICFQRPVVENAASFEGLQRLHRATEQTKDSLEIQSLLTVELERVAAFSEWRTREPADAGSQRIARAKDYLHAHWQENVTINELADAVELNPYHLVHAFHGQVGIPPHAYLMQLRILHSREMLRDGVSLVETALQTGFVDQSHFTRQFKKFTGVTPGRYLQGV